MDTDKNSKSCLSDFDQKQFKIMMAASGHLQDDVKKIMVLTILQELLDTKIKNAEKHLEFFINQEDSVKSQLTEHGCLQQFATLHEGFKTYIKNAKEKINCLNVRKNAFRQVISYEFSNS